LFWIYRLSGPSGNSPRDYCYNNKDGLGQYSSGLEESKHVATQKVAFILLENSEFLVIYWGKG
ncbi:MAG: hypothetical protein AB7O48_12885, partial [Cyclobacteriaceae bacterium]